MKGSTIAIIGAGAAAAAAGIALALSAKAQAAPPPPSCSCPSGEVCQNTDGSCPSGYFPDPNNAGCCQKCVQTAPCACDEVFDTVLCECSKLVPYAIKLPEEVSVNPFWMLYLGCGGEPCAGFEGTNLSSCKFVSGECNHDALQIQIKGSVVDSAGHPICNMPLKWSSTLTDGTVGTIPFVTPDNVFEGEFSIGLGLDSSTDSNGEFYIDVTVNIDITSYSNRCCDALNNCSGQFVRPTPANFSVTGQIAGTNISATVIILLNNTLCEWVNLL